MRAESYSLMVVEIEGRSEHVLPADTVTREEAASGLRGPYVPLAFRARRDVFYVHSARWPELAGRALQLVSLGARRRVTAVPPPDHPVWRRILDGEIPLRPSFLGACLFLARARAQLRESGGANRVALYTGQLQGLYARNVGCRSVARDLAAVRTSGQGLR